MSYDTSDYVREGRIEALCRDAGHAELASGFVAQGFTVDQVRAELRETFGYVEMNSMWAEVIASINAKRGLA